MEKYGKNKENFAPSHEGVQLDAEETSHLIRTSSDERVTEMEVSEPAMSSAPALLQDLL
jgi:hypothetical protein